MHNVIHNFKTHYINSKDIKADPCALEISIQCHVCMDVLENHAFYICIYRGGSSKISDCFLIARTFSLSAASASAIECFACGANAG